MRNETPETRDEENVLSSILLDYERVVRVAVNTISNKFQLDIVVIVLTYSTFNWMENQGSIKGFNIKTIFIHII